MITRSRPEPTYAHRCFVLARMVHLFHRHAEFRPDLPRPDSKGLEARIREVLGRDPRSGASEGGRVAVGGWPGLRALSRDHEGLLKRLGGGAWRSYVLRSHWRMVFPVTRGHQHRTAESLAGRVGGGETRVVHLVRFPSLTINHGLVLYGASRVAGGWEYDAYDPNDVTGPTCLRYEAARRSFVLGANAYWPGGVVDVIEIFRSWWI